MHPDLINNPLFLRYYKQWQDDPSSIVFAPIAEYFLKYDMADDALQICRAGLKKHPNLVSGRIVMAKIHIKRSNWDEAEEELRAALNVAPKNDTATRLREDLLVLRKGERYEVEVPRPTETGVAGDETIPSWNTITMAKIYTAQGHFSQARAIYRSLLESDPTNEEARQGLVALPPANI